MTSYISPQRCAANGCTARFPQSRIVYGCGADRYPREIVKESLRLNAVAIILSHNHPSGCPEASAADRSLTAHLKSALALVDVRLLDHIIVAGEKTLSFAETGIL
jgi:DNA repair protein RadC